MSQWTRAYIFGLVAGMLFLVGLVTLWKGIAP